MEGDPPRKGVRDLSSAAISARAERPGAPGEGAPPMRRASLYGEVRAGVSGDEAPGVAVLLTGTRTAPPHLMRMLLPAVKDTGVDLSPSEAATLLAMGVAIVTGRGQVQV